MKPLVDVIVPTFNNPQQLAGMLNSLGCSLPATIGDRVRVIVVNNGEPGIAQQIGIKTGDAVTVIEAGENLGWEGGLQLGLEHSDATFVAFSNDDVVFQEGDKEWLWKMLSTFNDPAVGAAGPCSNFVCGRQQLFFSSPCRLLEVPYLIGFFVIMRRADLDAAGGVDTMLPGGDDIDLSIRLRYELGKKLVCRRDVFVFHHGQQTGKRVAPEYWDTDQHHEETYNAIIAKHGMTRFWETWVMGWREEKPYLLPGYADQDTEGDLIRNSLKDLAADAAVLELGCGSTKTLPQARGVDLVAPASAMPSFHGSKGGVSMADIVADASRDLPVEKRTQDAIVARHVLEHCQNPIATLASWNRALKLGGRLAVAVPNQELGNTVVMNPEHVNSFTPPSLHVLARLAGFECKELYTEVNGVSFVVIYEAVATPHPAITEAQVTPRPLAAVEAA